MVSHPIDEPDARPQLTLGRLDRLRIQVGHRRTPEEQAHEQFLLDAPVPEGAFESGALVESAVLEALEPVVYAGHDTPRHHSVHQHRWHTTWGPSPGVLEIGVLITTGHVPAAEDGVTRAFRDLLKRVDAAEPAPITRATAVSRVRRAVAAAYDLTEESLSLSYEQHHPTANAWEVGVRGAGEEFHTVIGFVDGYVGSIRLVRRQLDETSVGLGPEGP